MNKIEKNNKVLYFKVVTKKNKHTYFRSKPGYVQITTGKRVSLDDIKTILYSKFDHFYDQTQLTKEELETEIKLWGNNYQIIREKGHFNYQINDDNIVIKGSENANLKSLKKKVYLAEMQKTIPLIEQDIKLVLDKSKIKEAPITYSYFVSKFGSFHKKKYLIKLNTFLATLDPIYAKYVLLHEYAHTIHFNHSSSFYLLLENLMPGAKDIQKQLKKLVIPL